MRTGGQNDELDDIDILLDCNSGGARGQWFHVLSIRGPEGEARKRSGDFPQGTTKTFTYYRHSGTSIDKSASENTFYGNVNHIVRRKRRT